MIDLPSIETETSFAVVVNSLLVNSPIGDTWNAIGNFADAGRFLNVPSKLVSGNGLIGSVRMVGDGILEVMAGSGAHSYTYAQVRGPMAAFLYHGCVALSSSDSGSCRLTYTLIYDQTTMEGARRMSEFERLSARFSAAAQAMKIAAEAAHSS
jgi:hypothetical protein